LAGVIPSILLGKDPSVFLSGSVNAKTSTKFDIALKETFLLK